MAPGTRLGPYEIATHLGAGGMGDVYRARDTRLDRVVALKISKEQFTPRFETEARATAALEHPHICRLYDICHEEGTSLLVMEYVDGKPLEGPLPLDRVLTYAGQIASALDAAHRRQIVHRDLKPSNVLVAPKSGVKLLDFGLAKLGSGTGALDDEALTRGLTGAGTIVGTLHYMSPEQLQGAAADARSDIFAFGLVLHEMMTGKRAFDGASAASIIAAILERPAPSIATVAPSSLDRLLQRCLAKDPDERWQSARDVKAALDLIVEPAIAVAEKRPAAIARQGERGHRRRCVARDRYRDRRCAVTKRRDDSFRGAAQRSSDLVSLHPPSRSVSCGADWGDRRGARTVLLAGWANGCLLHQ